MFVLLFSRLYKWCLNHMMIDIQTSNRMNASWKSFFLHLRKFAAIYSELEGNGDVYMMRKLKTTNMKIAAEIAEIAFFGFRRIDFLPGSLDQYPCIKSYAEYRNYLLNQCTTL